ncbi:MAG: hypothetical protein GX621_11500, partial [Pirellulaceae bacterium]|nr:hypothetical protein [Pirellulaceae bacterium]
MKHRADTPSGHEDAAVEGGEHDAVAAAKQDTARRWLLAGTMVLFVARPLFPSESIAQTGEGIVLVMLSLLLAAGWAVWMLQRRDGLIRFGAADLAALILLTLYGVSAIVACRTGNAREAINVVWAWIGLGVGFFL